MDRETPSKNSDELRRRVVVKNDLTETRYGRLTFSYFFSRFLPVFDNVDFLMKPEAFAKQLHLNHKKILKLFLLKFSNFNVNYYNFSNLFLNFLFIFNLKKTTMLSIRGLRIPWCSLSTLIDVK